MSKIQQMEICVIRDISRTFLIGQGVKSKPYNRSTKVSQLTSPSWLLRVPLSFRLVIPAVQSDWTFPCQHILNLTFVSSSGMFFPNLFCQGDSQSTLVQAQCHVLCRSIAEGLSALGFWLTSENKCFINVCLLPFPPPPISSSLRQALM